MRGWVLVLGFAFAASAEGCSKTTVAPAGVDGGGDAGTGACSDAGFDVTGGGGCEDASSPPVGTPCIPSAELSASFAGYREREVTVEHCNAACGSLACLVNHFRGRVSCPYGQDQTGAPLPGATPCMVPWTTTPVAPNDPLEGQGISAQCVDRSAERAVYCSCRCANELGKTDDGASYCACPAGYTCTQVAAAVFPGDPLAGGYCIADGTAYDPSNACANECNPAASPCPAPDAGTIALGAPAGATTYELAVVRVQNGLCDSQPLPTDSCGRARCEILYVLSAGDSCPSHPGLSAVDPAVAIGVRSFGQANAMQAVCALEQLAPEPCDSSPQAGWCYVTGPSAPMGCRQAILVSASGMPPSGAGAILGCR